MRADESEKALQQPSDAHHLGALLRPSSPARSRAVNPRREERTAHPPPLPRRESQAQVTERVTHRRTSGAALLADVNTWIMGTIPQLVTRLNDGINTPSVRPGCPSEIGRPIGSPILLWDLACQHAKTRPHPMFLLDTC